MSLIRLKNVSKFYNNNNNISSGFSKINLTLNSGEFVAITGESGSGKSTLLNVISGLDSYEEGEMYINGEETSHYSEEDYEIYRRKYIGNIFQNFNLINSYTVYQNIELVYLLNGNKKSEVKNNILNLIETVGLTKYKNTKVSKLSGGQKQRVAIARVLAKDTPIIVADEPTGSLDQKNAKSIIELLHKISPGKLIIVVTHNYEQVQDYATRRIAMSDGKIIEDKKIVSVTETDVKESETGNITFLNKINLGTRNSFNILSKFILLTLIFLFLVVSTFSQYSNLRKIEYDQDAYGYNEYFSDYSPNRVIINKKSRSKFTKDEISALSNLENISSVVENDILIDTSFSLGKDDIYFYGSIDSFSKLDKVDIGSMPTKDNEIAVEAYEYDYYLQTYGDNLIGKKLSFYDELSNMVNEDFVLVGIKYLPSDNLLAVSNGDSKLYFSDAMVNKISNLSSIKYSVLSLEINNVKIDSNDLYYNIKPTSNLKKGETYVFSNLNSYCNDYNCINQNIKLNIKDVYREFGLNLKVKDVITKDNLYKLINEKDYDSYEYSLLINEEDYNSLFMHDTYQISIYLEDTLKSESTLNTLDNLGYNTIYMRNVLSNELSTVLGILKIFRGVVFIIASVALFFISYFIIKLIFKSRNIYYSTIRILGSTRSQASSILRIELLVDLNIAFIGFLLFILLVRFGIINSSYISEIIKYFHVIDYILVYIILNLMSILISNRYANKLFKKSVMNAYREEV